MVAEDGTGGTLLSEEVDVTRFIPLKQPVLNGKFSIPMNFMIFNIEDALYATDKTFNFLFARTAKHLGEVLMIEDDAHNDDDSDKEEEGAESGGGGNSSAARSSSSALSKSISSSSTKLQGLRRNLGAALDGISVTKLHATRENRVAELDQVSIEINTL